MDIEMTLIERLAKAAETLSAHHEWQDADAVREAIAALSECKREGQE